MFEFLMPQVIPFNLGVTFCNQGLNQPMNITFLLEQLQQSPFLNQKTLINIWQLQIPP
jgi:hypothetical protein